MNDDLSTDLASRKIISLLLIHKFVWPSWLDEYRTWQEGVMPMTRRVSSAHCEKSTRPKYLPKSEFPNIDACSARASLPQWPYDALYVSPSITSPAQPAGLAAMLLKVRNMATRLGLGSSVLITALLQT